MYVCGMNNAFVACVYHGIWCCVCGMKFVLNGLPQSIRMTNIRTALNCNVIPLHFQLDYGNGGGEVVCAYSVPDQNHLRCSSGPV